MTNIDRAAEIVAQEYAAPDLWKSTVDPSVLITQALADAGLLMPTPQVIRTVEELEALHPYTLLTYIGYSGSYTTAVCLHPDDLPAVVVAPAAQVRAAREALGEA